MLLSDLLEARVVNQDGERVGRVHDVRVRALERRTADGYAFRVLGLVIGGRGIRERLGIDTARTPHQIVDRAFVDWGDVVSVDGRVGEVVISGRDHGR